MGRFDKKAGTPPGESSFNVAKLSAQKSTLPDRDVAQTHAADQSVGSCAIASPARSIESCTSHPSISSSPKSISSIQDYLGQLTCSPSQLPRIFPLQDISPGIPISSASACGGSSQAICSIEMPRRSYDFDLTACVTTYTCLESVGANFELLTHHYFRSVHSYLTILHRPRFLDRINQLSHRANAETSLILLCMYLCAEPTRSGKTALANRVYLTAKALFKTACATKAPSIELVQAGALLSLFEHNANIHGSDLETLRDCSRMALTLRLNALPQERNTLTDEERRRLYWGLLSLDW